MTAQPTPPARRGRPTKLTPPVQTAIVDAVKEGAGRETAAGAAGIDRATFLRWLAMGRRHDPVKLYRDFYDAVEKAEHEAVLAHVKIITAAAQKTWQAAAWWLERRYPDEWGRRDRLEVQGLLEREAERMARDLGLDRDEILAAAERILTGSR